jgi:hypothetical protein
MSTKYFLKLVRIPAMIFLFIVAYSVPTFSQGGADRSLGDHEKPGKDFGKDFCGNSDNDKGKDKSNDKSSCNTEKSNERAGQNSPEGSDACDRFKENFGSALGGLRERDFKSAYDHTVEAAAELPGCVKEVYGQATAKCTLTAPIKKSNGIPRRSLHKQ